MRLEPGITPDLSLWKDFLYRLKNPETEIVIGLVGKYVELQDAYKSISESFIHAGVQHKCKVRLESIHSEEINEHTVEKILGSLDGILVAPGFGDRGIEGKIRAIRYARENKIPFFGICLGMQCAVVEFARNVIGLQKAHSTEMAPATPYPVISLMAEQENISDKGGTMRLGAYKCRLYENTKAHQIYGRNPIFERHRHRYEFNNKFLKDFEAHGMAAAGLNPEKNLVEIMELKEHPWFIGVQFHPEFSSTVINPHPLFVSFVGAAIKYRDTEGNDHNAGSGKKFITYS
jgi:CTP synthase